MVKILSWNGKHLSTNGNFFNWKSPTEQTPMTGISQFNGFRLPTEAEWDTERISWGTNNSSGAFGGALKLTVAGYRSNSTGTPINVGGMGYYWASTVDEVNAKRLGFHSSGANIGISARALGATIRLIKDELYVGDAIDFDSELLTIDSETYNTVLNEITNRIWLDRNLGAIQVAISSSDSLAYGDLYQWGRATDGHEKRTSGTTLLLSSIDKPGHSDFILASDAPNDWRDPQNDDLWQGIEGINNPANF